MSISDIESRLTELYEELQHRQPGSYKVIISPEFLKSIGWIEGELVTKYSIPVTTSLKVKEIRLDDDNYQTDIWLTYVS